MSEMSKVEEVARAIEFADEEFLAAYPHADKLAARASPGWSKALARAAIEAMRAPTAAMASDVSEGFAVRVPGTIERVYGAMIDAALKE